MQHRKSKRGPEAPASGPHEVADDNLKLGPSDPAAKSFLENGNYLSFPLCSLAYGRNSYERVQAIVALSCVKIGELRLAELGNDWQLRVRGIANAPADFAVGRKDDVALMIGANHIGARMPSVRESLAAKSNLAKFIREFERKYKADTNVFLRSDMIVGADGGVEPDCGGALSWREFAVFTAILSCVGDKEYPVLITRPLIQYRSLGYKSKGIMEAELAARSDGALPLEVYQIAYTLRRLEDRGLFQCARKNARQTYYQTRMSQEELEKAVDALHAQKAKSKQRAERDRARWRSQHLDVEVARPTAPDSPQQPEPSPSRLKTETQPRRNPLVASPSTAPMQPPPPPSAFAARVLKFLNSTAADWSSNDAKMFSDFEEKSRPTEQELQLIEAYYAAIIPPAEDKRRKYAGFLLLDWGRELINARRWHAQQTARTKASDNLTTT